MIDPANLALMGTAFFVAAAAPGPATLATIMVSMQSGRRSGLVFGLGLSVGLAFWGLVAATGLGALLQTSALALTMMKLVGGAYLLWLAFLSARSATQASGQAARAPRHRQGFRAGLVLNLSNPKAVFAWMAVLTLGLGTQTGGAHVFAATVMCSVIGLGIYAAYALVFSTPQAMGIYRRLRRFVEAGVAALFALAGFGLIRSAFMRQV